MSADVLPNSTEQKLNVNPLFTAMDINNGVQQRIQSSMVALLMQMSLFQTLLGNITQALQGLNGSTGGMNFWEKMTIDAVAIGVGIVVAVAAPEIFAGVGALFAAGEAVGDAAVVGDALLDVGEGIGEGVEDIEGGVDAFDAAGSLADDLEAGGDIPLDDMSGSSEDAVKDSEKAVDDAASKSMSVDSDAPKKSYKERYSEKHASWSEKYPTDAKSRVGRAIKVGGGTAMVATPAVAAIGKVRSDRKTNEFNKDYTSDNNKASQVNNANSMVQGILTNDQSMVSGVESSIYTPTIQAETKIMSVGGY